MDDIVAIRATMENGESTYFMTYGRVHSNTDPKEIENLVLKFAPQFKTPSPVVTTEVCRSMSEATSAPLFFEGFFYFCQKVIPDGQEYFEWKRTTRTRLAEGRDIFALGPFGDGM